MEYRPELRVRFQLSEKIVMRQIDDYPDAGKAREDFGQRYEQEPNPAPTRFFILVITCSNVPNMSMMMPFARAEDGQHPKFEPAEVLTVIRKLNSGELKDSTLCG
jgi:hypothetical protein